MKSLSTGSLVNQSTKSFVLSGPVAATGFPPAGAELAAVVPAGVTADAAGLVADEAALATGAVAAAATGAVVAAAAAEGAAVVGAAAAGAFVAATVAAVVAVGLLLPPQAASAAAPAEALAKARKWRRFIPAPRMLRSKTASASGSRRTSRGSVGISMLIRMSLLATYRYPHAQAPSLRGTQ